jgi:hypothetical protein
MADIGGQDSTAAGPREYQSIASQEVACRWALPESWIRDQARSRSTELLPRVRAPL